MTQRVFHGTKELKDSVGEHLGYSEWLTIDQERVNLFADATGDHQWIHVDPVRAAAESPFGGPIAHGYLTLSLTNFFLPQVLQVDDISMGINYGVDKVRFPSPVPVGSRLRGGVELIEVHDIAGGVQVTLRIIVEREGSDKPACVVDALSRYLD